ncbi:MAG: hypothetical protein ACE5FG_07095 [Myxococcota bacterium]
MNEPFTLRFESWLHVLPVVHFRMEFASEARRAVEILEPRVVAVELPASLSAPVLQAVDRLPALSVVLTPAPPSGAHYLLVEPVDAAIEALRTARARGLETALVDLDVESYDEHSDPLPDSYAAQRIGTRAFYEAFRATPRRRDPLDAQREGAMAFHLTRLHRARGGSVLLVCGMHHAEGVIGALGQPQAIPFTRPVRSEVQILNLHPDCLAEVLVEAPAVQAIYELLRNGVPDPEPAVLSSEVGRRVGRFRLIEGSGPNAEAERLALLRDAARRSGHPADRLRIGLALFELAAERWERLTGEALKPWQRELFARYARNLALSSGRLVADPYDFLLAVRGAGDENLLHEAYRLLTFYPWAREASDLPSARLSAEELELGSRRIRIRPRRPRRRHRLLPVRTRCDHERYAGEWLEGFDDEGLCSYPPEDLVIEDYARFLRRKGQALLVEESARVEPFRTSLLDGIDLRETLRHWATERRIYVRELGRAPGDVGCVVVIFDEDLGSEGAERYPYRMTWLGEHDQESDMAFYSTSPAEGIQGPGIARCEYGGLMMSYPPRRLLDVWTNPDYAAARSKAEVLLLAALDYSEERIVVHVAPRPPRSHFRTLAERLDRKIVHIPIGQLSPQSLVRLRTFHILAGRSRREIAREYIW